MIFESEYYYGVLDRINSQHQPTIHLLANDPDNPNISTTVDPNTSPSYQLNIDLFKLSSIERTKIHPSEWKNPSIITSSTFVIGYCCAMNANDFKCKIPQWTLLFGMAMWNKPNQNIYFQKCKQNGLPPDNHFEKGTVTIKQRRDTELNDNNSKTWTINDTTNPEIWFQPDMYLCQVSDPYPILSSPSMHPFTLNPFKNLLIRKIPKTKTPTSKTL